jgi:hypothetical protein
MSRIRVLIENLNPKWPSILIQNVNLLIVLSMGTKGKALWSYLGRYKPSALAGGPWIGRWLSVSMFMWMKRACHFKMDTSLLRLVT